MTDCGRAGSRARPKEKLSCHVVSVQPSARTLRMGRGRAPRMLSHWMWDTPRDMSPQVWWAPPKRADS